ncbi:MAG: DUF692 domain-containing protein, partial [Coxiellaceae bacterium]|nr:DUF692 domain-containing protein [Coxiellaceae bacterium]
GGNSLYYLEKIRELYPIVFHGVSMSLGSCDPLDWDYLQQHKALTERFDPAWISDHLCWTGVNGQNLHDLMPLPYTEEALNHIVDRIQQVQDYLGRQMLIENVSSYVTYKDSDMTEWDFLAEVATRADCLLLLDVNNIYVSSYNHNFNAKQFIDAIPVDRVQQFHMAGHTNCETHIIDTHKFDIIDEVWDLYRYAVQRFGNVSIMIERDANIPPLADLLNELQQARNIAESVWLQQSEVVQA